MRENKYRDVKMSRVLDLEDSWHFYIAVKKGRGGWFVGMRV